MAPRRSGSTGGRQKSVNFAPNARAASSGASLRSSPRKARSSAATRSTARPSCSHMAFRSKKKRSPASRPSRNANTHENGRANAPTRRSEAAERSAHRRADRTPGGHDFLARRLPLERGGVVGERRDVIDELRLDSGHSPAADSEVN